MVEEDARVAGGDWSASRRQFLKYGTLGLILPAAFLQACGEADRTTLEAMLGYGNDARTFSPEAKRTVQAIAERLIPSDETGPGAREAMAWRYIDRALAGELEPERALYDEGLPRASRLAVRRARARPAGRGAPCRRGG
jgi:hypothetical protein